MAKVLVIYSNGNTISQIKTQLTGYRIELTTIDFHNLYQELFKTYSNPKKTIEAAINLILSKNKIDEYYGIIVENTSILDSTLDVVGTHKLIMKILEKNSKNTIITPSNNLDPIMLQLRRVA